jgi:PAS domain S-box-containing protein
MILQTNKALQKSGKKYRTLAEDSQTGLYIEQNEKIVFANKRFTEIYGYNEKELPSIEAWRLVHPECRSLVQEIRVRRLRREDPPLIYEAKGLTKGGNTIWIQRRNTVTEYNGRPAILVNIVDITEQKRAEEQLRKKNKDLDNFVYMVSQNMKTPVISMQGLSDFELQKYQEKLGEKWRGYLEQIKSTARRMEVLISDLRPLATISGRPFFLEYVPSSEIIKNITADVRERLRGNGTDVIIADNLPTIYCDRCRIYLVFETLVINAIKYMGDTKKPKIHIGYESKGDSHQFYVRDNGIGIDRKYHEKIFEMFYRLKESEDREGTGIRLAIVNRIVSNHGGKIWVESTKAKGATFYFTVPKSPKPLRHTFDKSAQL